MPVIRVRPRPSPVAGSSCTGIRDTLGGRRIRTDVVRYSIIIIIIIIIITVIIILIIIVIIIIVITFIFTHTCAERDGCCDRYVTMMASGRFRSIIVAGELLLKDGGAYYGVVLYIIMLC